MRSAGDYKWRLEPATPSGVSYIVRARNDNIYLDSAATAALVREAFRITSVTRSGPGGQNIALTFPGYPGATYRVQQSNTLAPGSWTETGITAPGTGNPQTLTVPAAVTGGAPGRRYYRVVGE